MDETPSLGKLAGSWVAPMGNHTVCGEDHDEGKHKCLGHSRSTEGGGGIRKGVLEEEAISPSKMRNNPNHTYWSLPQS